MLGCNDLGTRLREIREERSETQQALADAISRSSRVKRETVNQWESGTRQLKADAIIKLAQHFNITSDYLLGLSETKSTEKDIQVSVKTTGLSEKAIEVLRFFNSVVSDPEDRAEHRKTIDYISLALEEVYDQMVMYKQAPENHAPVTTIFHTMMQYLLSDSSELHYFENDECKVITSDTATLEINGVPAGYSIAELGRNLIKDQIMKRLDAEREERKWHPHD